MNRNNLTLSITRIILILLIILNIFTIFRFSSQSSTKSGQTSSQITDIVAEAVVEDYKEKEEEEKELIRKRFDLGVRKTAHFIEYGTLGALIFLLLLTWKWHLMIQYATSLAAVLLIAIVDEMLFQRLADGRAALWQDVWIDLFGAAIFATLILLSVLIIRLIKKRRSA